jgi:hypothetical protein
MRFVLLSETFSPETNTSQASTMPNHEGKTATD